MTLQQRNAKVSTRAIALETIRAEVALHGYVTKHATRTCVENKIGHEAFRKAVNDGLERRKRAGGYAR